MMITTTAVMMMKTMAITMTVTLITLMFNSMIDLNDFGNNKEMDPLFRQKSQ